LEVEEEEIYSAFSNGADPNSGGWAIVIQETEDAKWRYFYVFADGEVKEYFMEDQPIGGTGIVFRESEDTQ
jgi:ribonuclease HI